MSSLIYGRNIYNVMIIFAILNTVKCFVEGDWAMKPAFGLFSTLICNPLFGRGLP